MKKLLFQISVFISMIIAIVICVFLRKYMIITRVSYEFFLLVWLCIYVIYVLLVWRFVK